MPIVDLIYADDCPNVGAARVNLKQALVTCGQPSVWSEHRVGDSNLPDRVRGFGSPTILVDGKDVAGVEPGMDQCCRIYTGGAGVPSVEEIAAALRHVMRR